MHAFVQPLEHAFGARYELPLPLWMFVVGGAAVVLVSFLLVLRRATAPMPTDAAPDVVPLRRFHPIAGTSAILMTLGIGLTGVLGSQEVPENIAPTFFWVLLWVAVPLTAGLLGDWTGRVNPFAQLATLASAPRLRRIVLARSEPLPWRLGWWPALGGFVLLVLGELVFNQRATQPAFVGWILLGYSFLCVVLGLLFGNGFRQRGEVFSGLFNAWGRLGYWRFGAPGRRGFAGGLEVPFDPIPSRVVFVLLMLVSINFDGLLSTPQWARYEHRTLGSRAVGLDQRCLNHTCESFRTGSLVVLVLMVLAVFCAFAFASSRAGGVSDGPLRSLAYLLPSLVPIAFGYLVAHYLQYLLTNGQLLFPLLGNPGFENWPIHPPYPFNDDYEVHKTLFPNSFYWYLSVLVIVAVHVIAVMIANRRLASRAPDVARARRSEYPWLVAMVAYTAFSLTLIAQPITEEKSGAKAESAPFVSTSLLSARVVSIP